MPLLSVIIPVYNEKKTIKEILEKIQSVPLDKEIIVVDDGSSDGTDKILRDMRYNNLKVVHHLTNRGKGAAFLTGLSNATGEFVIVQDADLEYEPNDYLKMLEAINNNNADIILGARFLKGHVGLFMHRLGNRFLTGLLNFLFNARLNDYSTCYKLARRTTWDSLNLRAAGFDIEVEIICNALKNKNHILEVPISYYPRTYKAGKKIRWNDGVWAIFYMFKYRLLD
jgi:glycosyltransferase involved in cell wall biosynthesis